MERWLAKTLVIFGVFLIPFGSTLLPFKVAAWFQKRGEKGKRFLSCMMCFGGGVFLATYILHMAPEVRYLLQESLMEHYHIVYPVPDLIMAVGFFLVMFMEKIIICINARKGQEKKKQEAEVDTAKTDNAINVSVVYTNPVVCLENGDPAFPESKKIPQENTQENGLDTHGHSHEADLLKDNNSTRAIVLLVAISFHRTFEGMSMGLQSTVQSVWHLFVAVMCHEVIIGFSMGLEFVRYKWPLKRMFLACLLCNLFMPLGATIGTLVSEIGNSSATDFDLLTGVLQGIATGTFIYVTFFEILAVEMDCHSTGMSQPLSVLLGFLVMAALFAIPEQNVEIDMLGAVQNNRTFEATTVTY